jgi:tRNA dimethylallyltransferase
MAVNPQSSPPKIIVICGPTGIGKTAAGIAACRVFKGQIISADSMQVYRHMDIGTAKPTAAEQRRVRHHLIDVVDPDQPFDAARFSKMARTAADQLLADGCLPFVVGGTGLYIKSMLHGLFKAQSPSEDVRRSIRDEAERLGPAVLHKRLEKLDPSTARRLHPNDTYRIVRALETIRSSGKRISQFQKAHRFGETTYSALKIGLEIDRVRLYRRIDDRVDKMIAAGLLEEVESLLTRGYGEDLKAMQSIGYRHMVDYLKGRLTWDESVRTLKRDTRRFAKRQFTWFKADPQIRWTSPGDVPALYPQIKKFLNNSS